MTVESTLSWVPKVGIFSQTWRRLVRIFLSVQCLASSLDSSVILSETSARPRAQARSSFFVPPDPGRTSSERWAIR